MGGAAGFQFIGDGDAVFRQNPEINIDRSAVVFRRLSSPGDPDGGVSKQLGEGRIHVAGQTVNQGGLVELYGVAQRGPLRCDHPGHIADFAGRDGFLGAPSDEEIAILHGGDGGASGHLQAVFIYFHRVDE